MTEITTEQVEQWKTKYGKVMKFSLSGIDYYYRPINIDEYMNIQKLVDADAGVRVEVEIIKVCVLSPKLPEILPAGITLNLSEEISKISGFTQNSAPQEL